jgi:hypothetical protein
MMADAKSGKAGKDVPGPSSEKDKESSTSGKAARPATRKDAPVKSAAKKRTPTPTPAAAEDDGEDKGSEASASPSPSPDEDSEEL